MLPKYFYISKSLPLPSSFCLSPSYDTSTPSYVALGKMGPSLSFRYSGPTVCSCNPDGSQQLSSRPACIATTVNASHAWKSTCDLNSIIKAAIAFQLVAFGRFSYTSVPNLTLFCYTIAVQAIGWLEGMQCHSSSGTNPLSLKRSLPAPQRQSAMLST